MSIAELARLNDMKYKTLYSRLVRQGLCQADAISNPVRRKPTKEQILKAKAVGLNKNLTCHYILKCTLQNLKKWLADYDIEWKSEVRVFPIVINGIEYSDIRAACRANNANARCYYTWRARRTGTNQELLQQYIDFRAEKK